MRGTTIKALYKSPYLYITPLPRHNTGKQVSSNVLINVTLSCQRHCRGTVQNLKKKQKHQQWVVAGRQQLYCAVQSRSPDHCRTTIHRRVLPPGEFKPTVRLFCVRFMMIAVSIFTQCCERTKNAFANIQRLVKTHAAQNNTLLIV